jgi:hypothetical protein
MMRQVAAHPDGGGLGVERNADALALEVLRRADAATRVDEDVAVAKHARRKHRQRDERAIAAPRQADELGRRELGNVELLPAHHAVENLAARSERDAIELDPCGDHLALADGVRPVVAAAGEGQRETGHRSPRGRNSSPPPAHG